MRNSKVTKLVISALLCAIGIMIPMLSPAKILIPPASFTLGSHVATMIAMFMAPSVAVAVSLGTALGFFLGSFPPVIVLRALTHVVFAFIGSVILQKKPGILTTFWTSAIFSFFAGVIHAVCEVLVVTLFYFGDNMEEAYYTNGFLFSVVLLVGVGTVIHSIVDYGMAAVIWKSIKFETN